MFSCYDVEWGGCLLEIGEIRRVVHGELGAAVSRQPDVLDDRRRRVDVHQHRVGLRVAHHVRRPHPHTHRVPVLSRDVQQDLFILCRTLYQI